MPIIDLNDCFPEAKPGQRRGPLPKQKLFMDSVLGANGEKYVLYVGGVGSGKSLIGCITTLTLAVLYPGDYLVCRQFMPELRLTTMQTFLDICPKELIAEYRVADAIVRIKSASGKISNVIFRGLEEPDKHRSLNLNAAYIDESNQVSEEAFTLLQSRLRGAHVRKIYMTTNSGGHDWQYNYFVKQDGFKEVAKKQFKLIKAPSTENYHLPEGYVEAMLNTWSDDRIQREIFASFDAFEGQVYADFRRDTHVIKPFFIPNEWPRVMGIDHGFRNATCALWGAIDYDSNVYIYREFYNREWLIEEICQGKRRKGMVPEKGIVELTGKEKIEWAKIDPSVKAVRGQSGVSDWDTYVEYLPREFPLGLANNSKTEGIDRIKTYLKPHPITGKPRLFMFDTCVNLIEEMSQYKYDTLSSTLSGKRNEKEEPLKVNDHSCDALRYMIVNLPEAPKDDALKQRIMNSSSLEGSIMRELDKLRNNKKDDFITDF